MLNDKKVLALIPARGGSKGIKDKNIIDLCGKPLLAYTIEEAKKSKYIDDIILTTDSEKIAEVGKLYGAEVPFIRPAQYATDLSKTIDAVIHAVEFLKSTNRYYDTLILLQPTTPLRTYEDIDGALDKYSEKGYKSLASVSIVQDHPILIRNISETGELIHVINQNSTVRRQDMPIYYRINGCIYINEIFELSNVTSFNDNEVAYIMEKSHSVDIDEQVDLVMAEYYINNKEEKSCE